MLTKLQVSGVTHFKGSIEGRNYDSTTLLAVVPFPATRDSAVGFDTIKVTYGLSDNFAKFKGRQYPIEVEADLEITTGGYVANDVKFSPLNAPKA